MVDVTRLRVAIARLSRRLRKHELAGLTPTQLAALATVERAGPLRLGDLAAAERIAPSTLTRLVSALEEHGYVERCAVPGDARASTLAITPRGREVLERIKQESTVLLRRQPADAVPRAADRARRGAACAGTARRGDPRRGRGPLAGQAGPLDSEQQAGQGRPGLRHPLVLGREDTEQADQMLAGAVALVTRGPA